MAFDWNTFAKEQNRQPGSHAQYQLMENLPGGGYKSVQDPFYSSPEYINSAASGFGKPTEAGATMWSSQNPTSAFYSPTGSEWQQINESMLSDPKVAQAVMKGAGGGPGAAGFAGLKSKIPASVVQGIQGSSHSLGADILNKMWR